MTLPETRIASIPADEEPPARVKFSTRIDVDTAQQLHLFAAMSQQTIEKVVGSALKQFLPALDQLANNLARTADPSKNGRPGEPSTSEVAH